MHLHGKGRGASGKRPFSSLLGPPGDGFSSWGPVSSKAFQIDDGAALHGPAASSEEAQGGRGRAPPLCSAFRAWLPGHSLREAPPHVPGPAAPHSPTCSPNVPHPPCAGPPLFPPRTAQPTLAEEPGRADARLAWSHGGTKEARTAVPRRHVGPAPGAGWHTPRLALWPETDAGRGRRDGVAAGARPGCGLGPTAPAPESSGPCARGPPLPRPTPARSEAAFDDSLSPSCLGSRASTCRGLMKESGPGGSVPAPTQSRRGARGGAHTADTAPRPCVCLAVGLSLSRRLWGLRRSALGPRQPAKGWGRRWLCKQAVCTELTARLWNQIDPGPHPALPPLCCVAQGKPLTLSEPLSLAEDSGKQVF